LFLYDKAPAAKFLEHAWQFGPEYPAPTTTTETEVTPAGATHVYVPLVYV
jgi:hypothetical protein